MKTDRLQEFVGSVSRQEGHKHVLKGGKKQQQRVELNLPLAEKREIIVPLFWPDSSPFRSRGRSATAAQFWFSWWMSPRARGWKSGDLETLTCQEDELGRSSAGAVSATAPWCPCRRLWSGNRSSCPRQTFYPDTKCLSAAHTCSLWDKPPR